MSENKSTEKIDWKSPLVSLIPATYAGMTAGLYLLGYWSTFDVNILEYLSVTDIVKLAVYPIMILGFSFVPSALLIILMVKFKWQGAEPSVEPIHIIAGRGLFFLIPAIIIVFIFDDTYRWFVAAALTAISITFIIWFSSAYFKPWQKYMPHAGIRFFSIFIISFFIPASFAWGKIKGEKIWRNEAFTQVDASIFKDIKLLNKRQSLKYLGYAGEYFIFLSMDNKVTIVVQYSDLRMLKTTNVTQR